MSKREVAMQLINQVPDYKLEYVIAYLQGLTADERADDEFCANLIEEYENSEDKGEFVPFEEVMPLVCEVK